jgi:nicotinamide-nucleotide amidase
MSQKLFTYLKNNKLTLACVESMTGGLLADSMIQYSGSSSVLDSSFVTYATECKKDILKVNPANERNFSREMAQGMAILRPNVNIIITTSGHAENPGDDTMFGTYVTVYNNSFGGGYNTIYYDHSNTQMRNMKRNEIRAWVVNEACNFAYNILTKYN